MLAAAPGISPGELSRWMAAPATSVSSYVKRLELADTLTAATAPQRIGGRIGFISPLPESEVHQRAAALFGPVAREVIDALAEREGGVQESLLRLRGIVDGLRSEVANNRSTRA